MQYKIAGKGLREIYESQKGICKTKATFVENR